MFRIIRDLLRCSDFYYVFGLFCALALAATCLFHGAGQRNLLLIGSSKGQIAEADNSDGPWVGKAAPWEVLGLSGTLPKSQTTELWVLPLKAIRDPLVEIQTITQEILQRWSKQGIHCVKITNFSIADGMMMVTWEGWPHHFHKVRQGSSNEPEPVQDLHCVFERCNQDAISKVPIQKLDGIQTLEFRFDLRENTAELSLTSDGGGGAQEQKDPAPKRPGPFFLLAAVKTFIIYL